MRRQYSQIEKELLGCCGSELIDGFCVLDAIEQFPLMPWVKRELIIKVGGLSPLHIFLISGVILFFVILDSIFAA